METVTFLRHSSLNLEISRRLRNLKLERKQQYEEIEEYFSTVEQETNLTRLEIIEVFKKQKIENQHCIKHVLDACVLSEVVRKTREVVMQERVCETAHATGFSCESYFCWW